MCNCCSYQHRYGIWSMKSIEEGISVYVQRFLPIETNFVKNIKPQYSYLEKFCTDNCSYVNLRYDI
jgi:hypothetical protein